MRCVLYGALGFLTMAAAVFLLAMWRFNMGEMDEIHDTSRHRPWEL